MTANLAFTLTTNQTKALRILAAFGPGDNADIAHQAGVEPCWLYPIVYRLRLKGLAAFYGAGYRITDRGRDALRTSRETPLFELAGGAL